MFQNQFKQHTCYLLLLLLIFTGNNLHAQTTKTLQLTLDEVIKIGRGESPQVRLAQKRLYNNTWNYKLFQSGFKPNLALTGTLPSIYRGYSYDVAEQRFVNLNNINNGVSLELNQNIGKWGGSYSVSSGLQRRDIIQNGSVATIWATDFISLGYNQPLFGFNDYKWQQKLQPMQITLAEREYTEGLEEVTLQAANLFFDVYIAQLNLEAAELDITNADTLYRLSQGRYSVGKIAENELLQIELSTKRAEVEIANSTLSLQSSTERLRNFLGIKETLTFELTPPEEIPDFDIDPQKALNDAQ